MVDITSSLQKGFVEDDMLGANTRYTFIINTPKKIDYSYIPRTDYQKPVTVNSERVVYMHGAAGTAIVDQNFKLQCEMSFCYYCVQNPKSPGANGICQEILPDSRYLIVSGSLSGCGFAILFQENKVYIIHSGADSDSYTDQDKETRKKLINRDIYLMALYLKYEENYKEQLPGLGIDMDNGLFNEQLYEKIKNEGFTGCISVSKEEKISISGNDLGLYSYYGGGNDMICVINEKGKRCTVVRTFLARGGNAIRIEDPAPLRPCIIL